MEDSKKTFPPRGKGDRLRWKRGHLPPISDIGCGSAPHPASLRSATFPRGGRLWCGADPPGDCADDGCILRGTSRTPSPTKCLSISVVGRGPVPRKFHCLFTAAHGWPPYGGCGADSQESVQKNGAFRAGQRTRKDAPIAVPFPENMVSTQTCCRGRRPRRPGQGDVNRQPHFGEFACFSSLP